MRKQLSFNTSKGSFNLARVFISYSREDIEFAGEVVRFLKDKGHEIWMDKDRILGGAKFPQEIAEGIGATDFFVPLISKKSIGSMWVEREIYYAIGKNKKIVPLIIPTTLFSHT
jgi:hypothetical protein